MKISEFIEWLKEFPPDSDLEVIGNEKSLQGDVLIIQYASGALSPQYRKQVWEQLGKYGFKGVIIEYIPGRGPVEFLSIRKPV